MSTPGRMTAADLPPSSRTTGRRRSPQAVAIARPPPRLPVNVTKSTPGCPTRYAPASTPPLTMLTTPSGRPAAATASAIT